MIKSDDTAQFIQSISGQTVQKETKYSSEFPNGTAHNDDSTWPVGYPVVYAGGTKHTVDCYCERTPCKCGLRNSAFDLEHGDIGVIKAHDAQRNALASSHWDERPGRTARLSRDMIKADMIGKHKP